MDIEVVEESNLKPDAVSEAALVVNVESQTAVETGEKVKLEGEPTIPDAMVVDGGSDEIPVTKEEASEDAEEQRKAPEFENMTGEMASFSILLVK